MLFALGACDAESDTSCVPPDTVIACAPTDGGYGCVGRDLGYDDDNVYPLGCNVAARNSGTRCARLMYCQTNYVYDGGVMTTAAAWALRNPR